MNVHVLIGSNGVGKTTLLRGMAASLQGLPGSNGRFSGGDLSSGLPFSNLVKVAFSAFDPFDDIPMDDRSRGGARLAYVGLHDSESGSIRSDAQLAEEFSESLRLCWKGPRRGRWTQAMSQLARDPLLAESGIGLQGAGESSLFDKGEVTATFSAMSSGHKIAVLTLTKLVEMVEEKSLVLIDEPESHLHPPLLSGLMRAISTLLEERNGVAIVATHSPVVLQEVPTSCVQMITRSGAHLGCHRLDIETFGESTGVLTSSVFGLEVAHTGFHALLKDAAVRAEGDYEHALASFQGQLGGEGRAVLRMLCHGVQI